MLNECIFCNLYKRKEEIIFENECFYAIFDRFPINPGHALIVSKKQIVSLLDLGKFEWEYLKPAIERTKEIIESTNLSELYIKFLKNPISERINERSRGFLEAMIARRGQNKKPDGYNIGVNEGEAAGRTIHHLHFHIIPRYYGDLENPRGGIRNIIPGMGDY